MSILKFTRVAPLVLALSLAFTVANANTPVKKTTTTKKTTTVKKTVTVQPLTFETVEKKPAYIGGDSALNVFIAQNVQYPTEAKKNKEQGEVVVQFVIDEKGAIKTPKVLTSVSETLDAEALRLVNAMSAWTPGSQKGKKVAVLHKLPINFVLPSSKLQQALADPLVKALVDSTSKVVGKTVEEKVTKYGGNTVNSILNAVKKK